MPDRPTSDFLRRFGRAAVVTGATSGIGLAFARALAAQGFDLVLVGRRQEVLGRVASELGGAHGIRVKQVAADLATPEGVRATIDAARGEDVGLLIAAAGFGTSGAFVDGVLAEEVEMLEVNCRASMELAWHFAGRFAGQKRGGIVLFGSLVGFQGVPRAAHYAATKAYVQTLAEGLHHELKPLGVSVVSCAPGPIHSGFASRAGMTMGLAQRPEAVVGPTLRALGRRSTVRPGWLSKFLGWSLATLPRWGRVRVMGVIMGGMARKGAERHAGG